MARYFKYKSTADLLAENARLGIDLRFQDDLAPLNQPLAIGNRLVSNRWCIHPMEGCDGELDGTPGELTFRRYRRFGDGGAKLIWGEACAVVEKGRATPRQIWLNESNQSAFAKMVEETRSAHRAANGNDSDLLFGIQLTHSGRYCYRAPLIACNDPLLYGRYKVTSETPLVSVLEALRVTRDVRMEDVIAEVRVALAWAKLGRAMGAVRIGGA